MMINCMVGMGKYFVSTFLVPKHPFKNMMLTLRSNIWAGEVLQ